MRLTERQLRKLIREVETKTKTVTDTDRAVQSLLDAEPVMNLEKNRQIIKRLLVSAIKESKAVAAEELAEVERQAQTGITPETVEFMQTPEGQEFLLSNGRVEADEQGAIFEVNFESVHGKILANPPKSLRALAQIIVTLSERAMNVAGMNLDDEDIKSQMPYMRTYPRMTTDTTDIDAVTQKLVEDMTYFTMQEFLPDPYEIVTAYDYDIDAKTETLMGSIFVRMIQFVSSVVEQKGEAAVRANPRMTDEEIHSITQPIRDLRRAVGMNYTRSRDHYVGYAESVENKLMRLRDSLAAGEANITERQIRRIVMEMALKSYNVLSSDESLGSEDVPLGYAEEERGGSISYTPTAGDPRAGIYISKTYGQPGYRNTVARQYGKIPFPVNIFVLPSISALDQGITSYRGTMGLRQRDLESGTYSYDNSPILDLLERIQPGCTSVIEPGDATLIIQPRGLPAGSAEEMQVMDTRQWRQGDGVYLALHALYEAAGPLSRSGRAVGVPYQDLIDLLQYAGYDGAPLGEALIKILRARTLRDAVRIQKSTVASGGEISGPPDNDTEIELLVVANLIGKSPVNLNTFPTTRPDGEPLAEDLVLHGNEAIQALHDEVESHVGEVLRPGMITISCPYGRVQY